MAFTGVVTGNLGRDPELRFTPAGKAVLELNVAATASRKDQQTQQWSDDGDPLWVRASLWERDAERWAELLHKGDRVSVEGTLVLRPFQRKDGSEGLSHELSRARMLGYVPRGGAQGAPQNGFGGGTQPNPLQAPQTGGWDTPSNDTAPF